MYRRLVEEVTVARCDNRESSKSPMRVSSRHKYRNVRCPGVVNARSGRGTLSPNEPENYIRLPHPISLGSLNALEFKILLLQVQNQ
jgi:hypothetical protein